MNERELTARFRERFSQRIGDDAAVVGGEVYTVDALVEDVDFLPGTPLRLVARKSLAVNLSDLAAMGAQPRYALISLVLPPEAAAGIDEMIEAYAEAAREHSIEIIGGDLSRGAKLTVSVTAVGSVVTRPLLRSEARPGQRIFLSRPIGASAAGLHFLRTAIEGRGYAERELIESAIRRHLDPEPEVALGMVLAATPEVGGCIDVSDGLSTDLHHLCQASGVGSRIEKERIPVFSDLPAHARALGVDLRECVLNGGEEYALLFTASLTESEMSRRAGRPVYAIGRITREPDVILVENGAASPLPARGWDHFEGVSS